MLHPLIGPKDKTEKPNVPRYSPDHLGKLYLCLRTGTGKKEKWFQRVGFAPASHKSIGQLLWVGARPTSNLRPTLTFGP